MYANGQEICVRRHQDCDLMRVQMGSYVVVELQYVSAGI